MEKFEHSMDEQAWAMFAAAALARTSNLNPTPQQAAQQAANTADALLLEFRKRGRNA